MTTKTIELASIALTVLRYWAAQLHTPKGDVTISPDVQRLVYRAAWLTQGEPALPGRLPTLDVSQPLESIFNVVHTNKDEGDHNKKAYICRSEQGITEAALFPTTNEKKASRNPEDYNPVASLITEADVLERHVLTKAAKLDQATQVTVQIAEYLAIFQQYASSLPSPLPAVSLYDYARVHAAIATGLSSGSTTMILLQGTITGVQSFLYSSISIAEETPHSLRGRSFFLQFLTEVCARFLLREAGLPLSNLLYTGENRFALLLPNKIGDTPTSTWIDEQRALLNRFFYAWCRGDMSLALGASEVQDGDMLVPDNFRAMWERANSTLSESHYRHFEGLEQDRLEEVFAPQEGGDSNVRVCEVCGYHGSDAAFVMGEAQQDEQTSQRCVLCQSLEHLGQLLHDADFVLLHYLEQAPLNIPSERQPWYELLRSFGIQLQIKGRHANLSNDPENPLPSQPIIWSQVLALTTDAWEKPRLHLQQPAVYSFRPVANATPVIKTPQDFEVWQHIHKEGEIRPDADAIKPLAVMAAQSRGVKQLGVLRMDVDNLGMLFTHVLQGANLARTAALSRTMMLFFEGWIHHLCDEIHGDDNTSGGVLCVSSSSDDLSIVGSWHLLPELARRISEEFNRYAAGNPAVHISAGISLHQAQSPLYLAAEEAHQALQRAKDRPAKAALGWLGQVATWDNSIAIEKLKDKLVASLQQQQANHNIIRVCRDLHQQYLEAQHKGHLYGTWVWRSEYQLERMRQQETSEHMRHILDYVRYHLLDGLSVAGKVSPAGEGVRFIEQIGMAARWAEFEVREEQS